MRRRPSIKRGLTDFFTFAALILSVIAGIYLTGWILSVAGVGGLVVACVLFPLAALILPFAAGLSAGVWLPALLLWLGAVPLGLAAHYFSPQRRTKWELELFKKHGITDY